MLEEKRLERASQLVPEQLGPTSYYLELFRRNVRISAMSLAETPLTYALSGQPPFW
jgi:hypothetical protein